MHTARISSIVVDAAGRFLVTGSHDKTVRVWGLAGGELLRTLRPPIGAGDEGEIYAVALSPDGATVAAGGWTGVEWHGDFSIYLFDRTSGRMARRIGGMPLPSTFSSSARTAAGSRRRSAAATVSGSSAPRTAPSWATTPSTATTALRRTSTTPAGW